MAKHPSSSLPRSDHQRLWAPWRIRYVSAPTSTQACLFCRKASHPANRRHLIVKRGETAFVLLNRFPYNNGHVMVAPYRHVSDWSRLTPSEILEIIELMRQVQQLLTAVLHPDGFNIGCNIGRVAGAGVVGHLHVHVVPRWIGDTNFMPVCADTKVISQSLLALYDCLHQEYQCAHTSRA